MKAPTLLLAALAAAALAPAPARAAAGDWPSSPISVIVPYAPGGPTDTSARIVAKAMSDRMNASIVVENVPGAGAVIGATKAAQATPDGNTLFWGTGSVLTMTPQLRKDIRYDPIKSYAPIGLAVSQPFVLVTNPALGVKTVKAFVEKAKANPGKLDFSSAGVGTSTHLAAELFKAATGIDAVHIPYNGGAPSMQALLAGETDFLFDTPTTIVPMVKSGKVVPLGVTASKRWPALPDVPTMAEAGYPKVAAATWFGLLAPKDTPQQRIKQLSAAMQDALKDPQVVKQLEAAGFVVEGSSPEEFAQTIKEDLQRWGQTIKSANIKLEK